MATKACMNISVNVPGQTQATQEYTVDQVMACLNVRALCVTRLLQISLLK